MCTDFRIFFIKCYADIISFICSKMFKGKLTGFFIKVNKLSYNVGGNLLKIQKYKRKLGIIWFILLFALGFSSKYFDVLFGNKSLIILLIGILLLYVIIIIRDIDKLLLSAISFLGSGIGYYIIIVWIILSIVSAVVDNAMKIGVITYIVAGIIWCIYSLIANNKVSSLINQILSSIFALLVVIKDAVLSNITSGTEMQMFLEKLWTYGFSPILAINIIALMLCTVKGYWIDKYNDGKDITEDMLPDNIEQKDIIDVLFNRFIHRK